MKTKNLFQMLLMAGMVCCLSLSMTSCSDDDDNDSTTTPGGGSAMDTDVTDDEMVLGSILENWCDFDSEKDMKHGIIDQTFEPVEGDVVSDNDLIRTIVVGTRQGADDYAVNVLGGLGISSSSPAGFSWSNPAIGTIKYNHSTGNEQGVIEVEIKQIPKLWKLRLVATPEVNAGESPYYSKGDIVLNTDDNKYYICVSSHSYDQQSKWISFDCSDADRQTQKTRLSGLARAVTCTTLVSRPTTRVLSPGSANSFSAIPATMVSSMLLRMPVSMPRLSSIRWCPPARSCVQTSSRALPWTRRRPSLRLGNVLAPMIRNRASPVSAMRC